jgi:hypothetical protein
VLSTIIVVAVIAGATALAYLGDHGWWQERWLSRLRRVSSGWRRSVFIASGLLGWSGISFVMGWTLVRFPRGTETRVGEQPAPDWLWQLGLGLCLAAALVIAFVVITAPPVKEPQPAVPDPPTWLILTTVLAAFCIPMAIAAGAAIDSAFAWVPLLLAVICSSMILVNERTHWFW